MNRKIKSIVKKITRNKFRRKFDYYLNKRDFIKNDAHLNLMILRYLIHQLDKTVKYALNKKNIRGEDKYKKANRLKKILEERNQICRAELRWCNEVIKKYDIWKETDMVIVHVGNKSSNVKDLVSVIKNRRSIRFWEETKISEQEIYKLLEPAIYAPSSCNRQPWQFNIVENNKTDVTLKFTSNYNMLSIAPYVIYLSIDRRFHPEKFAPAIDAGIVAQNLLLSLEYYGYSACPVYQCEVINQKKIKKRLGLEKHQDIYLAIPFGIGKETVKLPARTPIENIVKII